MLFRRPFLDGIREGRITVAFRRWQRPSVRTGGTLLTAAGQLEIVSVSQVALSRISETDARRAGYRSLESLLTELRKGREGRVYCIELGALHPDPRVALRASGTLTDDERAVLADRLRRLDARSAAGPWTRRTLELIRSSPGVRAGDLCGRLAQDKALFKLNVRKLKGLGLTESLEVGYRLSPRGLALLQAGQDLPAFDR